MTKEFVGPPDHQVLLVPFEAKATVRSLGAIWHPDTYAWWLPPNVDRSNPAVRQFLPLRDRPTVKPPYIRINLIPQTSWGHNLRALMAPEAWKVFCREKIYSSTGRLCLVCGGRGPKWPVEADEVWSFDDTTHIQRLTSIVPLCPSCHEVRSAGFASANGRMAEITSHLAWVNRSTQAESKAAIMQALAVWQKRSQQKWTIDIGAAKALYGLDVALDATALECANKALLADAAKRRGTQSFIR